MPMILGATHEIVGTWFTIGKIKNYHQQIYETGTDLGFAAPYTAISGCGICLDEHIPETLVKCGVNEMLVGLPLYEHVVFFWGCVCVWAEHLFANNRQTTD